jgi:prepilin-type N-terminal cleavage/methylation domain-containing protein
MIKHKNTNGGFSLLESMVAITILLVAVVGPLSTIGNSLSQIYIARDQMVAINLAQEGIEAVRQIRDSNMIKGWNETTRATLWNSGELASSDFFSIEIQSGAPQLIPSTTAGIILRKDLNTGVYGNSGTETRFRRVIQIETISPDEAKITSTVFWKTSGGTEKRIDVTESLFGINAVTP